MSEANGHCWHTIGEPLSECPPAWRQLCCHCCATRVLYYRRPNGHGPYAPGLPYSVAVPQGGEGPCVRPSNSGGGGTGGDAP